MPTSVTPVIESVIEITICQLHSCIILLVSDQYHNRKSNICRHMHLARNTYLYVKIVFSNAHSCIPLHKNAPINALKVCQLHYQDFKEAKLVLCKQFFIKLLNNTLAVLYRIGYIHISA